MVLQAQVSRATAAFSPLLRSCLYPLRETHMRAPAHWRIDDGFFHDVPGMAKSGGKIYTFAKLRLACWLQGQK